jgi:AcrR family transcriptional regulator
VATTPKGIDRRVQRTQQLLKQAFLEVVSEKGFAAISIQDITDRANVNRGTFYAHFPDKYALLEAVISEKLQEVLLASLPPVSQWDKSTLQLLIRTVLDYFDASTSQYRLPANAAPMLERAAHEGVVRLLLQWLKQSGELRPQVPLETMANIMSWTILGAATQPCQNATTISSDEMARTILQVMMEGVEQLTKMRQDEGH